MDNLPPKLKLLKGPGFEIETSCGRFTLRMATSEYGVGNEVRRDAHIVATGSEPQVQLSRAIPAAEASGQWFTGFDVAYEQDTGRVQAVVRTLLAGNHAAAP